MWAFTLASAAVLALAARPARADDETRTGPCDALADYLREALAGPAPVVSGPSFFDAGYDARERHLEDRLRSTSPTMPLAYMRRVTPACRAETRLEAAPAAMAATDAAHAWTQRSEAGWIDRGRIIRCTMQDFLAYNVLDTWIADDYHPEARAVCAAALATWPDAEPRRTEILTRAVRKNHGSWADWEIDEAVVAAANAMGTPELREQLVPVLAAAHARHAVGYDRLRDAVCTDDRTMSANRAGACATLPAEAEHDWRRSERPARWLVRGGATAVYAGAIAAISLERDQAASRTIATTSGVLGGASAGIVVLSVVTNALHYPASEDDELGLEALILGSGIVGGVIGGVAAHAIAAAPGARAPVTAVGLAPLYVSVLAFTID